MKTIRGTRDLKGNTILKQPEGGTGRLRCPKCQRLATPAQGPDGKPVMKCGGCGAVYNITAMDRPAPSAKLPPR
jgi:uncharacterized C2H2 Zn-finger protein